jgi:hypothetical protein
MHLETAWAGQSLVNHVQTIRHANNEDIVELVDTVHLGKQLINNTVTDAGAVVGGPTLLADCVELVKDDDVQAGLVALFLVLLTMSVKRLSH